MPSTRNSVWLEFAPRRKRDVVAPIAPLANAGMPAMPPKASRIVVTCRRSRSSPEIKSTLLPNAVSGTGVRVAVTTTWSSGTGSGVDWAARQTASAGSTVKAAASGMAIRRGKCAGSWVFISAPLGWAGRAETWMTAAGPSSLRPSAHPSVLLSPFIDAMKVGRRRAHPRRRSELPEPDIRTPHFPP